jgi:hypothetical protein
MRSISKIFTGAVMKMFARAVALSLLMLPLSLQAKLKLSDFEGDFVSYAYTVGGESGNTGYSLASISQLSINKHGQGSINFLSSSLYTGPVGSQLSTMRTINNTAPRYNFKISVKNKKRQSGTIRTFDLPQEGAVRLTDFVAIKRNGKVVEFYENLVSNNGGVIVGSMLIVNKRQ